VVKINTANGCKNALGNSALRALAYGGEGHCAMDLPSDPKNKKCNKQYDSGFALDVVFPVKKHSSLRNT